MSTRPTWLHIGAACAWIGAIYVGCASGNTESETDDTTSSSSSGGSGSGGGMGGSTSASGGAGGDGGSLTVGVGGGGGNMGCAQFSAEAQQKPAAMLFVLDKTASMTTGNKWNAAQLAVATAIDKDAFDSMSMGLVTFPQSYTAAPSCVCDYLSATYGAVCGGPAACCSLFVPNGVSCGVSGLPQVPIAPAGTLKSYDVTGVRRSIYDYLVGNQPLSNDDDGSPIYEALVSGYAALDVVPNVDERFLVLITDGGFSCASTSNRGGYLDDYGCEDWEYPDNVNALINAERNDASAPVRTFVIGVPGSDSNGAPQGIYATPPYNMLLALSTYAVSGSPSTVDPACDSGAVFSQVAPAPATPCHIDMSSGFSTNALADAIAQIRGQALGCVYPLPEPPPGETIDPNLVNVETTVDSVISQIPRRSDPNDPCTTYPGCWDYNIDGDVELIGAACDALSSANDAKVDIVVGCATVLN